MAVTGGNRRSARRSASACRDPGRIGQQRGLDDLVAGQAGLHQHPTVAPAAADQATGPHQQGQRLLGGPVARRQQLLVEVEERDHVGRVELVQHRLGADVERGRRASSTSRCRR